MEELWWLGRFQLKAMRALLPIKGSARTRCRFAVTYLDSMEERFQIVESERTSHRDRLRDVVGPKQTIRVVAYVP